MKQRAFENGVLVTEMNLKTVRHKRLMPSV